MSPELGVVHSASPCRARWARMTGDERVRVCGGCKLNVYELAELSTDEARALVEKHEGKTVVRYWARSDGSVLTRDCPAGVRARTVRRAAAIVGLIVLAIVSTAAVKLRLKLGWIGYQPFLYQAAPDALACPSEIVMATSTRSPPARPPGRPPLPPLPSFREEP